MIEIYKQRLQCAMCNKKGKYIPMTKIDEIVEDIKERPQYKKFKEKYFKDSYVNRTLMAMTRTYLKNDIQLSVDAWKHNKYIQTRK